MNYSALKIGLYNAIKNASRKLSYDDIRLIINAHFNEITRSIAIKESEIEKKEKDAQSKKNSQ